jgi:hypothetical protein
MIDFTCLEWSGTSSPLPVNGTAQARERPIRRLARKSKAEHHDSLTRIGTGYQPRFMRSRRQRAQSARARSGRALKPTLARPSAEPPGRERYRQRAAVLQQQSRQRRCYGKPRRHFSKCSAKDTVRPPLNRIRGTYRAARVLRQHPPQRVHHYAFRALSKRAGSEMRRLHGQRGTEYAEPQPQKGRPVGPYSEALLTAEEWSLEAAEDLQCKRAGEYLPGP